MNRRFMVMQQAQTRLLQRKAADKPKTIEEIRRAVRESVVVGSSGEQDEAGQ